MQVCNSLTGLSQLVQHMRTTKKTKQALFWQYGCELYNLEALLRHPIILTKLSNCVVLRPTFGLEVKNHILDVIVLYYVI